MTKKQKSPKRAKRGTGAVAKVWEIAGKMPKAARKDVIAACVKAGINESTAKTQYQVWSHASKATRVAKVNGGKKTPAAESVTHA